MNDLHIILDIDQTMLDNMSYFNYNRNKNHVRKPDFIENDICIWMRPKLIQFLKFLDKNVKYISIWTNGSNSWLKFVVHKILSKHIPHNRFHLLLSIDFSTPLVIDRSKVFIKDTSKIFESFQNKNVNINNTVLIDDNYHNCIFNKHNSLPIKKYFVMDELKNKRLEKDLDFIIQIITVLKKSKNVSETLKNVYSSLDNYNKLFSSQ